MIKFLYIINKQGHLRLSRYFEYFEPKDRGSLQSAIIKNCLSRNEKQCTFFEHQNLMIVYRKYVSLYFIAGITPDENELAVLELVHNLVETLDHYFEKVSEMDIVCNLDRTYIIIDEMMPNGYPSETSCMRALAPLQLLDAAKK